MFRRVVLRPASQAHAWRQHEIFAAFESTVENTPISTGGRNSSFAVFQLIVAFKGQVIGQFQRHGQLVDRHEHFLGQGAWYRQRLIGIVGCLAGCDAVGGKEQTFAPKKRMPAQTPGQVMPVYIETAVNEGI
ncbi:hypothetical protein D3C72_1890670 [compost metagenome]